MSDDEKAARERKIKDMRSDPLSDEELQETRFVNTSVLDDMVSSDTIQAAHKKIDALWKWLGWIPQTLSNWKAILIAVGVALFIGGQSVIDSLVKILQGMLP